MTRKPSLAGEMGEGGDDCVTLNQGVDNVTRGSGNFIVESSGRV